MEALGAIAGVISALAALGSVWAVFEIDRRAAARETESRELSDKRARAKRRSGCSLARLIVKRG